MRLQTAPGGSSESKAEEEDFLDKSADHEALNCLISDSANVVGELVSGFVMPVFDQRGPAEWPPQVSILVDHKAYASNVRGLVMEQC